MVSKVLSILWFQVHSWPRNLQETLPTLVEETPAAQPCGTVARIQQVHREESVGKMDGLFVDEQLLTQISGP